MYPFYEIIFGSLLISISMYYQKTEMADKIKTILGSQSRYFLPVVEEYDFIVVGSSPSGSVVASRLSHNYKVLLIEAGSEPPPSYEIPAFFSYHSHSSFLSKIWISAYDKFTERVHKNIKAKILGGGASTNAMIWLRGHEKSFDIWEKAAGDAWSYENVSSTFKELEEFLEDPKKNDGIYGKNDGMIGLESHEKNFNEVEMRLVDHWHDAGKELGYEVRLDPAPSREGFLFHMTSKRFGRRESAYKTFLLNKSNQKNLVISKFSEAKKIDFDENKRAIGVIYNKHGKTFYAKANKEIIVSGGSFDSPLLLLRSGIGPAEQMIENNIPLIQDLPVGNTLEEHSGVFGIELIYNKNKEFAYKNLTEIDFEEFVNRGTGPLSYRSYFLAQCTMVSSFSKTIPEERDFPDYKLLFLANSNSFKQEPIKLMIGVSFLRPSSIGNITLNPADPDKNTLIWNTNYFSDKRDLKIVLEAIRKAVEIAETNTLKNSGIKINKNPIKGCENFSWGTEEYFICLIKKRFASSHQTSTCPMGRSIDGKSVVDSKLKVFGIPNLRVIDNSIQPAKVNTGTQAPAYLIGEKGAQFILEDYNSNN